VTVFNPVASAMQASYESLESRILKGGVSQFAISRAGFWLREMDEAGNHSMMHAERTGQGAGLCSKRGLLLFSAARTSSARAPMRAKRGSSPGTGSSSTASTGPEGRLAAVRIGCRSNRADGARHFATASPRGEHVVLEAARLYPAAPRIPASRAHATSSISTICSPVTFLLCALVMIAATSA